MQITLDVPEQYFIDSTPADLGRRIKLYAALLMFKAGEMSARAAAELAEVDRLAFATECQRHGIPLVDHPAEDLRDGLATRGEPRMSNSNIDVPADQIAAFCRRHRIRTLRLFGSVLRDDFRADSDVDFLVEFEPDAIVGLLALSKMELELGEMVGRKADLRTAGELSRYFRQDVVEGAAVLYAA